MLSEMNKIFEFVFFEGMWQQRWDEFGIFCCLEGVQFVDQFYCILILLLNVIGKFYIGYVLQLMLQDLLVCWQCMFGCNVFWFLGMDYVGIVMQFMVECQIEFEGMLWVEFG